MSPLFHQALQEEQKAADAEAAAVTAAATAAALRTRGDAASSWRVHSREALPAHPEGSEGSEGSGGDNEEEDFVAAHLGFAHRLAGSVNHGPDRSSGSDDRISIASRSGGGAALASSAPSD